MQNGCRRHRSMRFSDRFFFSVPFVMWRRAQQTSITLAQFNHYGDIERVRRTAGFSFEHFRYLFHQLSLILLVCVYVLFGGIFFSTIESRHFMSQDHQRKEIYREIYGNMRRLSDELFNEQLDEDFHDAYTQWRWDRFNRSTYIQLDPNRTLLFEDQIDKELTTLIERLADRQITSERFAYRWTYSTAILYAATLVTTIGYGNIAPKTMGGKLTTVIYALIGILLVVSWLKSIGASLALTVRSMFWYFERFFNQRYRRSRDKIYLSEKVPVYVPITLLVLYLLGGSLLFAFWEGWSYVDGAYFSFITFTTIGFGDLVPGEGTLDYRHGRSILCTMYLLFGVMLTAMCFALIQEDIDAIKGRLLQRLGFEQINLSNRCRN